MKHGLSWRAKWKFRRRIEKQKWDDASENQAQVRHLDQDELAALEAELLARDGISAERTANT